MHDPKLVRVLQSPCGSTKPSFLSLSGRCQNSVKVQSLGFKVEGSVVEMLHLGPVGDPILFLRLLGLKAEIELVALSLADLHPLVLWHYPVVDGSLEESKPKPLLVCAGGPPLQRGPTGGLSSPQSASLSQRAGSSSQLSGPWPHTSPSCWPSGRSHTSTV